jgi:hypothetical protein
MDPMILTNPYPKDVTDVKAGLEALSQREALLAIDELTSRRPLDRKNRRNLVNLMRQDRLAWGNARDAREDKKSDILE